MAYKIIVSILCFLILTVPASAESEILVNFDKVVTVGDRIVEIMPNPDRQWSDMYGSLSLDRPLPGRVFYVWEQSGRGCHGRTDLDVVLLIAKTDSEQLFWPLPLKDVRLSNSTLCVALTGLEDGEAIQLFIRIRAKEDKIVPADQ